MQSEENSPQARYEKRDSGRATVYLTGDWTMSRGPLFPRLTKVTSQLKADSIREVTLNLEQLGEWDSLTVVALENFKQVQEQQGLSTTEQGIPEGIKKLRAIATSQNQNRKADREKPTSFFAALGLRGLNFIEQVSSGIRFLGQITVAWSNVLRGRARFQLRDFWVAVEQCGPRGLPIITLISVLVGVILAFIGSIQLRQFGAQIYVANLVGLAMVREMGAVMAGVLLAGRTGAAFAAEIGTMQVNEEVDALTTAGLNPIEFLVVPRMGALFFMTPLLCIYADLMGILGGGLIATSMLDLSVYQYSYQTQYAIQLSDFLVGVSKSAVFGVLVGYAGCLRGIQCGRSADAVGRATTSAVVTSIVLIVVTDAVFAVMCEMLGV